MALFKNTHLGKITGRIGDNIFKTRKGTQYVAAPAVIFHKSNKETCVRARNIFGFSNKVFSALGKIYTIKQIWNAAEISNGTFINKMQIINKKKISENLDLSDASFLPYQDLFPINSLSAQFDGTVFQTVIEKLSIQTTLKDFHKCSLFGILVCSNPAVSGKMGTKVFHMFSDDILFNKDEDHTFDLTFFNSDNTDLDDYSSHIFYISMLIKNYEGVPVRGSKVIKVILNQK